MDVSDFFFFCSGRGKGPRRQEGGDRFFIEIPRGGGGFEEGEGPGRCLRRIGDFFWRGGANIFFRARNVLQVAVQYLQYLNTSLLASVPVRIDTIASSALHPFLESSNLTYYIKACLNHLKTIVANLFLQRGFAGT